MTLSVPTYAYNNPNQQQSSKPQQSTNIPSKQILSKQDLDSFLESETCANILSFIDELNSSIKSTPLSALNKNESPIIKRLMHLMDKIDSFITLCPPDQTHGSRFGNSAFKLFFQKLELVILFNLK